MFTLQRRLAPVLILIVSLFLFGTLGYTWIEGWSPIDALYMTTITLSTVGYGEVRTMSSGGRIFTIVLILLGVGTVAYAFSTLGEYFLTSNLGARLLRRRTMRTISRLRQHFIICGYGRVGEHAARGLAEDSQEVVVIEKDPAYAAAAAEDGFLVLEGDGTKDELLNEAGIQHARGLLVCTGSDPDNLFMVLSGRALSSDLYIIARAVSDDGERKMVRAGADKVISPFRIGGEHMAKMALRPKVMEFLDFSTVEGGEELALEELTLAEKSPLVGMTVVEADLRRQTGLTLVSVRRGHSSVNLSMDQHTRLMAGDALIVLGTVEQLTALESLAGEG